MKKYKTALIIGRFQPFHKGHLYLLQQAKNAADTVIIGIGSSNIKDDKNPFAYITRKRMIETVLKKEKLTRLVKKIIPLPDVSSDEKWLQDTLKKTGKIDIVIGNNEWVNGIFQKAGYKILPVKFYKREILEGQKIRNLIRNAGKWDTMVQEYLVALIKKQKFI